ncbi:MAG: hypothetical protein Q9197_000745 [Variospora fuerteventurae]
MQTSRIRGGTPVEYWGEQHSINDPELIARLKDVARLTNLRQAEHIQESIDAANAIFQPLPDDESPEPDESPIGGLPSPAASPPRTNFQLHTAQATSSAMSHPHSEPVDIDRTGAEVEADSISGLREGHLNTQTGYQPQPLLLQPSRKESRRRQPSLRSTITTRSQVSDRHTFWELDPSGRRGRRIMDRPLFGAHGMQSQIRSSFKLILTASYRLSNYPYLLEYPSQTYKNVIFRRR